MNYFEKIKDEFRRKRFGILIFFLTHLLGQYAFSNPNLYNWWYWLQLTVGFIVSFWLVISYQWYHKEE